MKKSKGQRALELSRKLNNKTVKTPLQNTTVTTVNNSASSSVLPISTPKNQVYSLPKFEDLKFPSGLVIPNVRKLASTNELDNILENFKTVGKGSFGAVHKANLKVSIDAPSGKRIPKGTQVAVKTQKLESETIIENIINEIRALRKIMLVGCKNVNEIYDVIYVPSKSVLIFILEYIDGIDLDKYAHLSPSFVKLHDNFKKSNVESAEQIISESDIFQLFINPLTSGLLCIHKHGIAHRDIKPENIMVEQREGDSQNNIVFVPKWIDLGMACFDCAKGGCVGSPVTMAPEVMTTRFKLEAPKSCNMTNEQWMKADIYSFGCTIYELVVGAEYPLQNQFVDLMFENKGKIESFEVGELLDKFRMQYFNEPPDLSAFDKSGTVYRAVRKFLSKCLSFNPANRELV